MAAGFWLFVPSTNTGHFRAGTFVAGNDRFPYFMNNVNVVNALEGRATYHGLFRGMHTHSAPGALEFDELTGNAWLDADFANSTTAGIINGSITGLQIDGTGVDGSIILRGSTAGANSAAFGSGGVGGNRVLGGLGGMIGTGEVNSGNWLAGLYGPDGDATQHPSGVGGALGGGTDDGQTFMGVFLAHEQ